jgi:hypothetical protein
VNLSAPFIMWNANQMSGLWRWLRSFKIAVYYQRAVDDSFA